MANLIKIFYSDTRDEINKLNKYLHRHFIKTNAFLFNGEFSLNVSPEYAEKALVFGWSYISKKGLSTIKVYNSLNNQVEEPIESQRG